MNNKDFNEKLTSVVCSCKTVEQLNVALAYTKQARKNKNIGDKKYHFMFGVITALKGVLNND
jgi:hypothetical protein